MPEHAYEEFEDALWFGDHHFYCKSVALAQQDVTKVSMFNPAYEKLVVINALEYFKNSVYVNVSSEVIKSTMLSCETTSCSSM